MSKPTIRPAVRGLVSALAAFALSGYIARAHPFASGITNSGGTISFILNETADSVGVHFPDNNSTNYLGANLAPGVHTFTLGAGTNHYVISVRRRAQATSPRLVAIQTPLTNSPPPRGGREQ